MSVTLPRPQPATSKTASSLLPALLGALIGVGIVKIALVSGTTAGLQEVLGTGVVVWGGKLGGLGLGAAVGWLVSRRGRTAQ